jgi:hypothetical protein
MVLRSSWPDGGRSLRGYVFSVGALAASYAASAPMNKIFIG